MKGGGNGQLNITGTKSQEAVAELFGLVRAATFSVVVRGEKEDGKFRTSIFQDDSIGVFRSAMVEQQFLFLRVKISYV